MKKNTIILLSFCVTFVILAIFYITGFGEFMETAIASFAGAGVVVLIDWYVKFYLNKKRNFENAIAIQIALNSMLSVALQIRESLNTKKENHLKNNKNELWNKFRYLKIGPWMNTFDVNTLDWDFTQYLKTNQDKVIKVLKQLIKTRFGYQALMFLIIERNKLLEQIYVKIEQKNVGDLIEDAYKCEEIIGKPLCIKLISYTDKYIEEVDNVINDCNNSFTELYNYIIEKYSYCKPLSLDIYDRFKPILEEVKAAKQNK